MRAIIGPVLAAMLLAGCTSLGGPDCGATPTAIVDAAAETNGIASYRLASGDRVRLTVFRQPDLSGEFALDGDGQLALPLIGDVAADGLTAREIEKLVRTRLIEGGYLVDPQVGLQVLTYRPFYILGEVNKPGEYEYRDGMNVINAVALAGGYTYRANSNKIVIRRGGCSVPASATSQVMPGEIVVVPERFF